MPESTEKKGLSRYERWSLWFSFFGIVISIFGFTFVVQGLDDNKKTYATNTYLQTYGWTIDIDKTFSQYPDYRPFFYNNVPITARDPKKIDTNRLKAIAEQILDNLDAILNNQTYFDTDTIAQASWKDATCEYYKKSPVMDSLINKFPTFWPNVTNVITK